VAATNKNLETLIDEGHFRPDLFYRLNVFSIQLPALRERREDVPLLAEHFVNKFSLAMSKRIQRVAPDAMQMLQQYDWPGNVRELENAVERAMVVAQEPELKAGDFLLRPRTGVAGSRTLEDMERAHILQVLEQCGGNQTRAAGVLDIDRVTLHNKLKRYGWSKSSVEK
jgi:two-component system response regulator HydG